MKAAALLALALMAMPVLAKDHSSQYQVGTFTNQIEHRSIHTHNVRTADGLYSIDAPVSVGGSMAAAAITGGTASYVNNRWFMDNLKEGDKVLFASQCPKYHRVCDFWLPDPGRPGKEFHTYGHFVPNAQLSNTQALCGTGKLKPEVEAQVCPASSVPDALSPTAMPAAAAPAPAPSAPTTQAAPNPK